MAFSTRVSPPAQLRWFWSSRRAQTESQGLPLSRRAAATLVFGQGRMGGHVLPLTSTCGAAGAGKELAIPGSLSARTQRKAAHEVAVGIPGDVSVSLGDSLHTQRRVTKGWSPWDPEPSKNLGQFRPG